MRSTTIKLVLHDGTPFGLTTVELTNWSGRAIIVPRPALGQLRALSLATQPTVYFLRSEREDRERLYVGQSDELSRRLSHHAREKDWWDESVAFTSSDFGATAIRYLEHVFVRRLLDERIVRVDNGTAPSRPPIPREHADAMDEYVDRASDVLIGLGYHFIALDAAITSSARETGIAVRCTGPHADAHGFYDAHGLLVVRGSVSRHPFAPSTPDRIRGLRDELVASGILQPSRDGILEFTKDYLFSSPSTAASVVLARSSNGWTDWKDEHNLELRARINE